MKVELSSRDNELIDVHNTYSLIPWTLDISRHFSPGFNNGLPIVVKFGVSFVGSKSEPHMNYGLHMLFPCFLEWH